MHVTKPKQNETNLHLRQRQRGLEFKGRDLPRIYAYWMLIGYRGKRGHQIRRDIGSARSSCPAFPDSQRCKNVQHLLHPLQDKSTSTSGDKTDPGANAIEWECRASKHVTTVRPTLLEQLDFTFFFAYHGISTTARVWARTVSGSI